MTRICILSDTHGSHDLLDVGSGDLLIHCGDCTAKDTAKQHNEFLAWFLSQDYKHRIFIGGNHDNFLVNRNPNDTYLSDSGTEFERLKIWGCGSSLKFSGQNPKAMAFSLDTEEELEAHWDLIPPDTDILITHTPPFGILDSVNRGLSGIRCGSPSLAKRLRLVTPILHCFGHLHREGCRIAKKSYSHTIFVNAAIMDEMYEPRLSPVFLEI